MRSHGNIDVECVIDAHVHVPARSGAHDLSYADRLLGQGIDGAVVLLIPPMKHIVNELSLDDIRSAYQVTETLIRKYASELVEALSPEGLYFSTLKLAESYGAACRSDASPTENAVAFYAAADLSLKPDELKERLEGCVKSYARGIKVISTLFFKYLDDPTVEAAFEVASQEDVPVVVHAGCDPGVWELPKYCKYGNPKRLERIVKRYRDVRIVIAHVGGYSAIAPGVFTLEAINLAKSYGNVYVDVSAVPSVVVLEAARELPAEKMLYGSDYPVVDGLNPGDHQAMVYRILLEAGYGKRDLELVFHGNAEEHLGVRCRSRRRTEDG
ncbi:MAG: amidohydrolase family protein [Thermoproteota archaeon]